MRVIAPARLHFGLLQPGPGPGRRFGGVGVMVDRPALVLDFASAARTTVEGPHAERLAGYIRTYAPETPVRITVEQAPPAHSGFGTGTALALALGTGLDAFTGRPPRTAIELAKLFGRGDRSAVGIHGFAHGGFLVEAGKRSEQAIAPLIASMNFPPSWRIVLIRPVTSERWAGPRERQAFAELAVADDVAPLTQLILLGMLPALAEGDAAGFGAALTEYNARVGERFAAVQGGRYSGPAVAGVVRELLAARATGVGQSSWGPTVFAVAADPDEALRIAHLWRGRPEVESVMITAACNQGARVER